MDKPKLISLGAGFPIADLIQVHSRFERVVNFHWQDRIVSVVTPEIGAGAWNLVLSGFDLTTLSSLDNTPQAVILNGQYVLPVSPEQLYNPEFHTASAHPERTRDNIDRLQKWLLQPDKAVGLLYLITGILPAAETAFDLALQEQFSSAYQLLQRREFAAAAAGFRGRGYGLTPAGDDFNAGLLLGLSLRETTEKKELSKIRACIYANSLGNNLIANTFLYQARQGWVSQNWRFLLDCICFAQDDLEQALGLVLNQGETSGADTLAGFLAAWSIKI